MDLFVAVIWRLKQHFSIIQCFTPIAQPTARLKPEARKENVTEIAWVKTAENKINTIPILLKDLTDASVGGCYLATVAYYHVQNYSTTICLDEGGVSHRSPVLWSCDWAKLTYHMELNNLSQSENKLETSIVNYQWLYSVKLEKNSHWNKHRKYHISKHQDYFICSTYIFTSYVLYIHILLE